MIRSSDSYAELMWGRVFGWLLIGGVIVSALRSVIVALALMAALLTLYGVFFKPRETFAFLAFSLFSWTLQSHFAPTVTVIGGLMLIALIFGRG